MNPFREAIRGSYGSDLSSWVPYLVGAPRLRFELAGDEGSPEVRFLRALDRCERILRRGFPGGSQVLVEIASFQPVASNAPRNARTFLGRLGLHPRGGWHVERILVQGGDWDYVEDPKTGNWLPPLVQNLVPDPTQPSACLWRWSGWVDPGSSGVRNLCAYFLSIELGVPGTTVLKAMRGARLSKRTLLRLGVENLALIDPGSSLLMRPYDDRGLDLLAPSAEVLRGIYRDLSDLLLEHDRGRILTELA